MELSIITGLLVLIYRAGANNCGSPPSVSGGTRYVSGNYAYYSCSTGYDSSGSSTIQCISSLTGWLYSYSWQSLSFSCTIRNCGTPSGVSNGGRSYPGTTYGNTATYYCNTGYYGSGDNTIYCNSNGNWDGLSYSCHLYNCGNPPTISHGSRSYSGTTYSYTATYSCNTGYYSTGGNQITCQHGGSWSTLGYSCTIKDCGNPGGITNGQVSYSTTTYQSSTTYSCDVGYNIIGSPTTISCLDTGVWQSTTAACQIVDCGTPADIQYSTISAGATIVWSLRTYKCNVGYVPQGNENITCQVDGTWSSTDYLCPPYDCGAPDTIADCDIDAPDTTFNNTAVYTCHRGHNPSENDTTIVCTPTGWENFTFWCIPEDCEDPTIELFRSEKYWTTTIFRTINSSEVEYICDIGYTLDPEDSDGIVECNYTGIWEEIEFRCIFNYCKNISLSYKLPSLYPANNDGLNAQMYILNDTMFFVDCCGVIAGWEFKPTQTGFVYLMIWRRNTAGVQELVGFNTVLVANKSEILNVTITDEKIAVRAFDQIGWFSYEGSPIAYEDCDPATEATCPQQTLHVQGPNILKTGITVDWDTEGTVLSDRSYAIKFYFTRNTQMAFLQSEYNVSIADHLEKNGTVLTFSTEGVDHAETATYTFEAMGDTPLTQYFYVDEYFGTVKVYNRLPRSNETNEFVYNVTAVDGCENYASTILSITTYNAPPKFVNLPSRIEIHQDETPDFKNIFNIDVLDPTNDDMCCTLAETSPRTLNFALMLNSNSSPYVETTKNSYFSTAVVDSYYVRLCCQDKNDSTFGTLFVKVKGERETEAVSFPGWFFMSLILSCVPIFLLMATSCGLLFYLVFFL